MLPIHLSIASLNDNDSDGDYSVFKPLLCVRYHSESFKNNNSFKPSPNPMRSYSYPHFIDETIEALLIYQVRTVCKRKNQDSNSGSLTPDPELHQTVCV